MLFSDTIHALRAYLTTEDAKKEEEADVRLRVAGTYLEHVAVARRWEIRAGWIGNSGQPAAEWFGSGPVWKRGTTDTWRRPLDFALRICDIAQASIELSFRNVDDDDDDWGFMLSLVAETDHGDVVLCETHPNVTRLNNHGQDTWHGVVGIIRPQDDFAAAIQQGNCGRALEVALNAMERFQAGTCYAQHGQPAEAARVLEAALPELQGADTFRVFCRNLMHEQRSLATIQERDWTTQVLEIPYGDSLRDTIAELTGMVQSEIEARILNLANAGCFGPIRLVATVTKWVNSPPRDAGLLLNYQGVRLEYAWDAYDFVKRFGKDNEFCNGKITAAIKVGIAANDRTFAVDVTVPTVSDLHMVPDSWNPEFNVLVVLAGLASLGEAMNPRIESVTSDMQRLVVRALPPDLQRVGWTMFSLQMSDDRMKVGVGYGA